jgi:hypothetical protein
MSEKGVKDMNGRNVKTQSNPDRQRGFVGCTNQNDRSVVLAKASDGGPDEKANLRTPGSAASSRRSHRYARRVASAGISTLGLGGPKFAA